jgi:NAD(P)-dependent dehydrogenase (short-subunit alcohol dehydrogenase family)
MEDLMPAGVSGEVVMVTGAAGGVGRAVAHVFARHGARLGLLARDAAALDDVSREVRDMGGTALPLAVDVADSDAVEEAARRLEDAFGPLDVWVNNAMATVFARFIDITAEEYLRATQVTYLGCVNGTRTALRRMVPRDHGSIVQVGSALSYRAIPLQSAYCGAKFAIRGFTDSVRTELLHDRSRVWITMVQLPGLNTPQFSWCLSKLPDHPMPVPPIYQPEVAAEAVHWAAHHRRRELFVGGSAAAVILGNKLLPGVGDRYLARTGVSSQQMRDRPQGAQRPSNLFDPVTELAATHGIFDDVAKSRSLQLWCSTHRRALLSAAVAAGAGLLSVLARSRR